jgi:hypothetical protein
MGFEGRRLPALAHGSERLAPSTQCVTEGPLAGEIQNLPTLVTPRSWGLRWVAFRASGSSAAVE